MVDHLTDGVLLDSIRGIHWPARRVTRGVHHGGHRSRRIGSSPEFMQFREYRPGDEPWKIDWKLYGRTNRVMVRQTHDDSNLRTTVLVDASASMAYPQPDLDKWKLAMSIAVGLTAVTIGDRDPAGLAVVGADDVQVLPPRSRAGTTYDVIRMLSGVTPEGARPLAPVLSMLRASHRIAIISDFLGDADALLELAREMVASGREIFAVHVIAREELEPRDMGTLVVDPEEESIRRPFDDAGLALYRSAFAEWREELAASWNAAGAFYQVALTDEPADRIIRRVVTPMATTASTHA